MVPESSLVTALIAAPRSPLPSGSNGCCCCCCCLCPPASRKLRLTLRSLRCHDAHVLSWPGCRATCTTTGWQSMLRRRMILVASRAGTRGGRNFRSATDPTWTPVAGALTRQTRFISLRTTPTHKTGSCGVSEAGTDWLVVAPAELSRPKQSNSTPAATAESPANSRVWPRLLVGLRAPGLPTIHVMRGAPRRPSKGICCRCRDQLRCRPAKSLHARAGPRQASHDGRELAGLPHVPVSGSSVPTYPSLTSALNARYQANCIRQANRANNLQT